jgi:hypothetical protein
LYVSDLSFSVQYEALSEFFMSGKAAKAGNMKTVSK